MDFLFFGLVFDILRYAIDSMVWGVLFALAGVALLFFLIKGIYPRYTYSPLSIIVGVILFVLLSFQSVFICGAFKVKAMTDNIERSINSYIPDDWKHYGHTFTEDETQQIAENLIQEYPLFGCYVGGADFSGHDVDEIAESMVDEIHDFMNAYIWRRVFWSLGFVVVGTFIVVKTMQAYRNATRVKVGRRPGVSSNLGGARRMRRMR